MITAERAALVDGLAGLPAADWDKPSLCAGWSVRQVVGHIVATAQMTPPGFVGQIRPQRVQLPEDGPHGHRPAHHRQQ